MRSPQPVTQQTDSSGAPLGARMPPTCLSLCCFANFAIAGYEDGDMWDGCCARSALTACLLNVFCGCLGSIYAAFIWKPDPVHIRGDGTQRTVNNLFLTVCCVGGAWTISFWESGDICTGCCEGDALIACLLDLVAGPVGAFYACCCWNPNPNNFKRNGSMHGGGAVGNAVKIGS